MDELDREMKELLRRISKGQMSFGPDPDAPNHKAELKRFQGEAGRIMNTLDRLAWAHIIGGYTTHRAGRAIDRVLITSGLTFEGQDLARQLRERNADDS